ncbi:MAG: glycosyltransferase family A protein [Planctomycetota bacterium]
MSDYDATLAITTHNRKEELATALDSAIAQSLGSRLHILVIDDGSSDGTSEFLRSRYAHHPNITLDAQHPGLGLIAERNRFPELAKAPVIVSMDDDAIFPSPKTIEQTLDLFARTPRVAAVAIPYIDVNIQPDHVRQRAPDNTAIWACEQYRGTAHAIRTDVFTAVGRYRAQLVRQGEENDLCIRLLDAGYIAALGSADPIHHLESPKRSKPAIYRYTARNSLYFAWHNVPMPAFLPHYLGSGAKLMLDGVAHPARLAPRASGIAQGLRDTLLGPERSERQPVRRAVYTLSRRLRAEGPLRLDDIEPLLPPITPAQDRTITPRS